MSARAASPFSRAGLLALVVVGFGVFLAILYLIGMGNPGAQDGNNARAHAAAKGLNGYSALVELVEADGFPVSRSRSQSGLETSDLLILTPPHYMDPDELASILERREYLGPTLVILPKWNAMLSRYSTRLAEPDEAKDGWVVLGKAGLPLWAGADEGILALELERGGTKAAPQEASAIAGRGAQAAANTAPEASGPEASDPDNPDEERVDITRDPQSFTTLFPLDEMTGSLPTSVGFFAPPNPRRKPIVLDQAGRMIAFSHEQDSYYEDPADRLSEDYGPSNWIVFVVEPDLMNNWGLADQTRAMAALSLVRNMDWGEFDEVVFDLTLNGFGGTINLLTLAFEPPFVAATICLILAIAILGWRAFLRFGPATARARETAFGKARLVTNGADLIVRAGRLALLVEPYISLSAKRMARSLGLPKPEPGAINAALALRQPDEASFTERCNDLRSASKVSDIVRAARALSDQTRRPETRGGAKTRASMRESHQE
ncbi:MAG: DUF4350 domain-containing protein [Pseudomonadota bacterium]